MKPHLPREGGIIVPTIERLMKRVVLDDEMGCWLWRGSTTSQGYGQLHIGDRKYIRAHRISYELFVGPIPDGLTIDHLCCIKLCVNPAHLEPVTMKENILRAKRGTCPRGHEYDYVYPKNGARGCRRCQRVAEIRWMSNPENRAHRNALKRARRRRGAVASN